MNYMFHHVRIKTQTLLTLALITLLASFMTEGPLAVQAQGSQFGTPGFNSQFNTSHAGWAPVAGVWTLEDLAYYKSAGVPNAVSSIKHIGNYHNMIYTARMKKATGCRTNCGDMGLIVRGNPLKLGTWKDWSPEYWFAYANSGYFHVILWDSIGRYTILKDWTFSPKIVKGGWNNLQVTAVGSIFKFYINGAYVWGGNRTLAPVGQVGIGYYRAPDNAPLFVDWATLSTVLPMAANQSLEAEPITAGTEVSGGTGHLSP